MSAVSLLPPWEARVSASGSEAKRLASTQIRVLGTVEVGRPGAGVDPGGRKRRTLLGLLCARLDTGLASDELSAELWGAHPPSGYSVTLRTHVSRLRSILEATAGVPVLLSRGHRYRLDETEVELDASRFEKDVGALTGRVDMPAEERAEALAGVLGLWKGIPFTTADSTPILDAERSRLERLHAVGQEERIETDMTLGRHRHLLAELESLTGDHPTDCRLWHMYTLCLYRSGRVTEAVRVAQALRNNLRTTAGLETSRELSSLEYAMLIRDPTLDWRPKERCPGPASRAALPGRLTSADAADSPPGQRQLELGLQLLDASRPSEALTSFTSGLADVGDPTDEASRTCACDLLLGLARGYIQLRDVGRAKAAAFAAANLARELGEVRRLGEAVVLASFVNRFGDRDDALLELCGEVVDRLGDGSPALKARVLAGRADHEATALGDGRLAVETAGVALSLAQRSGDPGAIMRCLSIGLFVLGWTPRVNERLLLAERLIALGVANGDRGAEYYGIEARALSRLVIGDLSGFDRDLDRLDREATQGFSRIWVPLWKGMRAMMDGRLTDVDSTVTSLLALASNEPNVQNLAAGQLFFARREEGRLLELLPVLEQQVEGSATVPAFSCALALALLDAGQFDRAGRILSDLVNAGDVSCPRDLNWTASLCLLTEVAVALEDAKSAAVLWRELHPYHGQLAVLTGGLVCVGAIDRYLAMLSTVTGGLVEARGLWESAMRLELSTGCKRLAAPTMAAFGTWLIEHGAHEEARRARELVRDSARILG
jgi:SARP family transcriptional regulator, regulator of embCAB operon